MSASPEQLEEIHDAFLDQLLAVIPRPVIEAVRGPGSVEDDIVLAVKAMAEANDQLIRRMARIRREISS